MILGSGRRLPLNSATHPETLQINSAIASFFCLSSDTACDSGILPDIPCLMILICVFYLFPFCRPRSPSQTTESLLYYRVLYLIIPEVHRNNGACQTVYRSCALITTGFQPTRRICPISENAPAKLQPARRSLHEDSVAYHSGFQRR